MTWVIRMLPLLAAVVIGSTLARAQSSGYVYDPSRGRSYEAERRTNEIDSGYRIERENRIDLYSRDGERVGTGQIDGSGNVYSNETGRRIGVWRD